MLGGVPEWQGCHGMSFVSPPPQTPLGFCDGRLCGPQDDLEAALKDQLESLQAAGVTDLFQVLILGRGSLLCPGSVSQLAQPGHLPVLCAPICWALGWLGGSSGAGGPGEGEELAQITDPHGFVFLQLLDTASSSSALRNCFLFGSGQFIANATMTSVLKI